MRLLFVVKYLGQPRLDAVIENKGHRRKIRVEWVSTTSTAIPSTWFETVKGEVEWLEAEELRPSDVSTLTASDEGSG